MERKRRRGGGGGGTTSCLHLLDPEAVSSPISTGRGAEGARLGDAIEVLCTRRLDHRAFPLVEIEATYVKSRADGLAVYESVVTATGIAEEGDGEALGVTVGDSEQPGFWAEFLLSLRARGLQGVEFVVAEDHGGLGDALHAVFPAAAWQRVDHGPVLVVADEPFVGANRVVFEWNDSPGSS